MMVGLLILLSGLFIWLLFSEKSWIADALDKYAQDEKEYWLQSPEDYFKGPDTSSEDTKSVAFSFSGDML